VFLATARIVRHSPPFLFFPLFFPSATAFSGKRVLLIADSLWPVSLSTRAKGFPLRRQRVFFLSHTFPFSFVSLSASRVALCGSVRLPAAAVFLLETAFRTMAPLFFLSEWYDGPFFRLEVFFSFGFFFPSIRPFDEKCSSSSKLLFFLLTEIFLFRGLSLEKSPLLTAIQWRVYSP